MSSPGPPDEAGRWTAGTPTCNRLTGCLLRGPTSPAPHSSLEDPLVILSQGVTGIFPSTSDPYPEKVPSPQQPLQEPGLWVSVPTSIPRPCLSQVFPTGVPVPRQVSNQKLSLVETDAQSFLPNQQRFLLRTHTGWWVWGCLRLQGPGPSHWQVRAILRGGRPASPRACLSPAPSLAESPCLLFAGIRR